VCTFVQEGVKRGSERVQEGVKRESERVPEGVKRRSERVQKGVKWWSKKSKTNSPPPLGDCWKLWVFSEILKVFNERRERAWGRRYSWRFGWIPELYIEVVGTSRPQLSSRIRTLPRHRVTARGFFGIFFGATASSFFKSD
jgi:hypothetical protein